MNAYNVYEDFECYYYIDIPVIISEKQPDMGHNFLSAPTQKSLIWPKMSPIIVLLDNTFHTQN